MSERETLPKTSFRDRMPESAGVHPNGALGPSTAGLVQLAALGDLEALRTFFEDRLKVAQLPTNGVQDGMLLMIEALTFGRLVASRGGPEDIRKLAGALCAASIKFRAAGRPDLGDHMMAETLSILEQLAEVGDDLAAMCSAILLRDEDATIVGRVRALRQKAHAIEVIA
jgi:hypothetical protein